MNATHPASTSKNTYYILTFLTDFATNLSATIYVLFLLSKGLDLFQVNLVNFAFMAGIFFFEIPTGAYADSFGRRRAIILSSFLLFLGYGVYFFSQSIVMFIIAELLAALAYTFASGALDAWVVDSIEDGHVQGKVDFVFSHAGVIGGIAGVAGGLIGAYAGSIHLALPFAIGSIASLAATLFASRTLHEPDRTASTKQPSFRQGLVDMRTVAKESMLYGAKHPVIFWLIITSVVSSFAFMALNMYWSPRMNELAGGEIWVLGWAWAGISIAITLGNYIVRELVKQNKPSVWILIVTALCLALPIFFSASTSIFALALSTFLMHEVGRGMLKPTHKAYINSFVPKDKRATVLSFDSMLGKLGAAAGLVVMGLLAKRYSIEFTWIIAAVLLLALIPLYLKAADNEKREALNE